MSLDDDDNDEFENLPQQQKSRWDDSEPPELEWDESEVTALVDGITGSQRTPG